MISYVDNKILVNGTCLLQYVGGITIGNITDYGECNSVIEKYQKEIGVADADIKLACVSLGADDLLGICYKLGIDIENTKDKQQMITRNTITDGNHNFDNLAIKIDEQHESPIEVCPFCRARYSQLYGFDEVSGGYYWGCWSCGRDYVSDVIAGVPNSVYDLRLSTNSAYSI